MSISQAVPNEFVPNFLLLKKVRYSRNWTVTGLLEIANINTAKDLRYVELSSLDWRGSDLSEIRDIGVLDTNVIDAGAKPEFSFKTGDYVKSPRYGSGRIESIELASIASKSMFLYVISLEKSNARVRVPVINAERVGLVLDDGRPTQGGRTERSMRGTSVWTAANLIATNPSRDRLRYLHVLETDDMGRREPRLYTLAKLFRDLAYEYHDNPGSIIVGETLEHAASCFTDEISRVEQLAIADARAIMLGTLSRLGQRGARAYKRIKLMNFDSFLSS